LIARFMPVMVINQFKVVQVDKGDNGSAIKVARQ
jgi:hypothetical protein